MRNPGHRCAAVFDLHATVRLDRRWKISRDSLPAIPVARSQVVLIRKLILLKGKRNRGALYIGKINPSPFHLLSVAHGSRGGFEDFSRVALYIPKVMRHCGDKTSLLGILCATIIHTRCQREYISILMNLCFHFHGGRCTSNSKISDEAQKFGRIYFIVKKKKNLYRFFEEVTSWK